ncbi:NAD-dependent epimerase/dehydratase family protein [Vreelandella titanicae]|uniref:NAD-dependent epimerase/dehydratase family protein n=1 Tax=Vreelandella titanicae TaxID=664683 RepID=A0A558J1X8_9GAMM|nr:NAD-dependent epimerase/dehydratase family protein [Halomonas titanicae]TVU87590.1 NAD-dependent epimerase/dehydratase family protein [Halomonas titanicae]
MKILVIGGTGFIGRYLCPFLATGHQVIIMSRNSRAEESYLQNKANISYKQGDITNREQVFAAMEGVDYVVNMSSTVIPSTSNHDPIFDVQSNLVGALNVLDAAVKYKIKKIVFISSGGTVYGEGSGKPFKEDDATNPICSYGVVKLAIEKYIQMYYHLHGLPYAILRVSNPFGFGQVEGKPLGVVSVFVDKILRNQTVEIWGDGTISRDFIYIEDVTDAIEKSLWTKFDAVLLNIGCGKPLSLNELLFKISNILNVNPEVVYRSSRNFDVKATWLNIERAKNLIDWSPSTSFEESIKKMAYYY